jgi:ribosomal protein S27AE
MTTSSRRSESRSVLQQEARTRAWARPYPAIRRTYSKNLRHGTWYPVVRDELPDRVTVRIGTRDVDVPRRLLEIRTQAPTCFSVVMRVSTTTHSAPRPSKELGKHYIVCPKCGHRAALMGHPDTKQCPQCGHVGEIAWWEG